MMKTLKLQIFSRQNSDQRLWRSFLGTKLGLNDFEKMTDGELLCNLKNCRRVVTGTAYITRCSHAFCEEDGFKLVQNQHFEKKCPACHSPLMKNYDLVKVILNPNDQFKSMVLAGLRPDVVMDIATRAILFWSYQQHQELLHQSLVWKNLKDVLNRCRIQSEVQKGFLKSEIESLRKKQEDAQKELEKQNKKYNDLCEKLALKAREVQKWQMMYESLRLKQLSAKALERDTSSLGGGPMALSLDAHVKEDFLTNTSKTYSSKYREMKHQEVSRTQRDRRESPDLADRNVEFVFRPRTLTTYKSPPPSPKLFIENAAKYRLKNEKRYKD